MDRPPCGGRSARRLELTSQLFVPRLRGPISGLFGTWRNDMRISQWLMRYCILLRQRWEPSAHLRCRRRISDERCSRHDETARVSLPASAGTILLTLMVSACASPPIAGPGGDADYRHPQTGEIQHCDNHTTAGLLLFGVIGAVLSGNNYADCKSDLEAKGYVRIRGTTQGQQAAATLAPPLLPPPAALREEQTSAASSAERKVELLQVWILGTWQTLEGRSGSVDGIGKFQFQQQGSEIKWKMVRTGWFSGVQTTQTASGSVSKISESSVELVGKYESSNLGNVEGRPLRDSFVRDGFILSGYERVDGAPQIPLWLKKIE